jgi:hypothetical protein
MVVNSTDQPNSTSKSVKEAQRAELKAKFDRRRRAALKSNGRVITAVVAELHSMVSSGSAILQCSDDRAVEQLRKMDGRPPRQQLPKEVYLAMLATARTFTSVEKAPTANGDKSMVESEALKATAEFCADLQKKSDMDPNDAKWITDIDKSYGSCVTNFPESDGTSSIENLDLTSDVEDGNMLPRFST